MTLSARPKTVEQGEWLAHHGMTTWRHTFYRGHNRTLMPDPVVEHYRNLWNFVRVIYEKEDNGRTICNPTSCPRMSAGMSVLRPSSPSLI